jgi:hypothetical protein
MLRIFNFIYVSEYLFISNSYILCYIFCNVTIFVTLPRMGDSGRFSDFLTEFLLQVLLEN